MANEVNNNTSSEEKKKTDAETIIDITPIETDKLAATIIPQAENNEQK